MGDIFSSRVDENWEMQDGTMLPVSIFFPKTADSGARFPLIVFVHPLFAEKLFYESTAMEYAGKGYVCVTYTVRGSYGARGQFHIIDSDIELGDLRHIITLASRDTRFPVLEDDRGPVVGVTGYSMGGIHSYLIAPREDPRPGDPGDPRVRAVVPMHGGADLLFSILPNGAPSILVGGVILGGCYLQNLTSFALTALNIVSRKDMGARKKLRAFGEQLIQFVRRPFNRVDPRVAWAVGVFMRRDTTQFETAKHYIEQRSVRYWCDQESDGAAKRPITAATLTVTGWNDDAFFPNHGLRILSTCMDAPGRMIITNHGHLAGFGNSFYTRIPGNAEYDWVDEQVHMWFDHHLKGVDNGTDKQPRVSFYRHHEPEHYGQAGDFPLPGTRSTSYYLDRCQDSGTLTTGSLSAESSQPDFLVNRGKTGAVSFVYYQDIPELLGRKSLSIPKKIRFFTRPHTCSDYVSDPLGEDLTIMGTPLVEIYYRSSQEFTQLNPTLYEVTAGGREVLVTRGAYEGRDPTPWSKNDTAANPIEMQACYRRFSAGSRIKLQIATADRIDIWPNKGPGFIVLYHDREAPSRLVLPVVPNSY